jgi:hypothetical protein
MQPKKKKYHKPVMAQVDLKFEEAVLGCCKTSTVPQKSSTKKTCSNAPCTSASTNRT